MVTSIYFFKASDFFEAFSVSIGLCEFVRKMSNEILCYILQFQSHSLILRQLIQAESGLKEYKADWLTNAKVVTRDATGRFASKGLSIKQSVQDTTAILKQGFDLTTDTIQSLLKDPEFRKRAGLAAGLPMAKLISNLATQARLNPKSTEKLDEWIANATKEFADQYGDDKNPMAQAIRKANLAQPPKDASFNEKMEFRVAQFAAYKEALESPEDYSKRDELIGKAAAAAIPIGISLAIALGFEVALPLFMAQGVNWATVLSSVAIGEAADFAVQKGMDKLEINNPALRIGASMVAGALAGGLVTGVNNKIKSIERLKVERLAKEEAKRLADEEAERLAKQEIEQMAIEKAKQEADKKAKQLAKEEADRQAKEKAEQLAKQEALEEAKYIKKQEAAQLAKEKAKQEAKEKAEKMAEQIAKEKAKLEAEHQAKEKAKLEAKLEAKRQAKEKVERDFKEETERLANKWSGRSGYPLQEIIEDEKEYAKKFRHLIQKRSDNASFRFIPKTKAVPDYPNYIYTNENKEFLYQDFLGREQIIQISDIERTAIARYTDSRICGFANEYLRRLITRDYIDKNFKPELNEGMEHIKDIDEYINILISALNKIPRYSPDRPLARYESTYGHKQNPLDRLQEGKIICNRGFLSTTPESWGTGGFSDGHRDLKYLIHPSEKSLGRDITQFNQFSETEVLFQPSTKFEVIKIYTKELKSFTNKGTIKELTKEDTIIKTLIVELKEYSAT